MTQFSAVNSQYGAPMGRASYGRQPDAARPVRLFRVRLDSGGYDDGGAYWGHGAPLYCATDDADYREFTRANHRAVAVALMQLDPAALAKKLSIAELRSVGITREHAGHALPSWVVRKYGAFDSAHDLLIDALDRAALIRGARS